MAHTQQALFCTSVRDKFPAFFSGSLVLDVGSLDINGNNQFLFDDSCCYIGVDLTPGPNVDVLTPAHLLGLPDSTFDTVISTECLEHDRFYIETIRNIFRLLKPGGLLIITCATTGRPEHGTIRTTPQDAPLLSLIDIEWGSYYKNITENDIRTAIDIDEAFNDFYFTVNDETHDLYFYGVKHGKHETRLDYSWLLEGSQRNIKMRSIKKELEMVQAANSSMKKELENVLMSKSWRITRPLRIMMQLVKKSWRIS